MLVTTQLGDRTDRPYTEIASLPDGRIEFVRRWDGLTTGYKLDDVSEATFLFQAYVQTDKVRVESMAYHGVRQPGPRDQA